MVFHRMAGRSVDVLRRRAQRSPRMWFSFFGLVGVYETARGMRVAVTEDFDPATRTYSTRVYRCS